MSTDKESTIAMLSRFCSTDDLRHQLIKPFSRPDGCTYATDGRIAVCVEGVFADLGDVPVEGVMPEPPKEGWKEMPSMPAEVIGTRDCSACDGGGYVILKFEYKGANYYPEVECPICEGSGINEDASARLDSRHFRVSHLTSMDWLIDLEVIPQWEGDPELMHFRFKGGRGVCLPLADTDGVDVVYDKPILKKGATT